AGGSAPVGGVCTPRGNAGNPCTEDRHCLQPPLVAGPLQCVDGVCCNSACEGQCQACDTPENKGTCVTIGSPSEPLAPVGGRPACAGAGTGCEGFCDGQSATSCSYPGNDTEAGEPA